METAETVELFERPRHPYSEFLLASLGPVVPDPVAPQRGDNGLLEKEAEVAAEAKGVDFSLPGCRFAHRCPYVFEACADYPPMFPAGDRHHYSCFLGREIPVVTASRS
jgi:oligopeptide/dipeptide ABC transporter ATP-binding protein